MLTLLVGLAFGSTCHAQAASAVSTTATGPRAALIKQLRSAHKLLVIADHDYDGHRARAAEEVHKAIRDLEGKNHAPKIQTGSTTTPASGTATPQKARRSGPREPQGTSDAQLNQALAVLKSVQTELNGHHPRAAANVAAAIGQINTALSIK
jgi:hypothetical protein